MIQKVNLQVETSTTEKHKRRYARVSQRNSPK